MKKLLVFFLLIPVQIVFPQSYSQKATNLISEFLADEKGEILLIIEPLNCLYGSSESRPKYGIDDLLNKIPSDILDSLECVFNSILDTFEWYLPIQNIEKISLDSFNVIRTLPIIRIRYQITPKTEKRHERKVKRVIERYKRKYSSLSIFQITPPLFWENYCIFTVKCYIGIRLSGYCLYLFDENVPNSFIIIFCRA